MKKNYRSIFRYVLLGMKFSDKVSKGEVRPSAIDCLGWGRINALNKSLTHDTKK